MCAEDINVTDAQNKPLSLQPHSGSPKAFKGL